MKGREGLQILVINQAQMFVTFPEVHYPGATSENPEQTGLF